MTDGAYFRYGDLRRDALRFALDSLGDPEPVAAVRAADLYFRFLTGEWQDTNSEIPSQKPQGTNFPEGLR